MINDLKKNPRVVEILFQLLFQREYSICTITFANRQLMTYG